MGRRVKFIVLLLFVSVLLHAQYNEQVFRQNYKFDSAAYTKDVSLFTQLFNDINKDLLVHGFYGMGNSNDHLLQKSGVIVLPASNYELLHNRTPVPWIYLSPQKKYLAICKVHHDYSSQMLFVFNYNTGEFVANFKNVRQLRFSESDNQLLISYTTKWEVFSLSQKKTLFSKNYESDYQKESGFDTEDLLSVEDTCLLFVEEHKDFGKNQIHILSKPSFQVSKKVRLKDNVSLRNLKTTRNYLAFTEVDNKSYKAPDPRNPGSGRAAKKSTVFLNINTMQVESRLENFEFLSFAEFSPLALVRDTETKKIYQYDIKRKKVFKPIESKYSGEVTFCKNDSLIAINPQAYSFDNGFIHLYNSKSGELVTSIPGTEAIFSKNQEFFIVKSFYNGEYIPHLYRFSTFKQVLKMDMKDKMRFSKRGGYLIMEMDKTNLYSKNRFSIIDLETSERKLAFEDNIQVHGFDEKSERIISIKDDVIHLYDIKTKSTLFYLYVNSDGWVCFDEDNRFDCSTEFKDKIAFACPTGTSRPPKHFRMDKMYTDGLWSKHMNKLHIGSSPSFPRCKWYPEYYYLKSFITKMKMPSVSFVIDHNKDLVDLENYSGKPIELHKSDIFYQCNIWTEKGDKLLFIIFADFYGGYLAITPDGYFSKSSEFAGKIGISIDNKLYNIEQLFDTYFRPDIIEGLLAKQVVANRTTHNLKKGISIPPLLELSLKEQSSLQIRGAGMEDVSNKGVQLKITALDRGGGISGIRLFNNGKLVGDKLLPKPIYNDSVVVNFNVSCISGTNSFEAIGFSSDYTSSKPITLVYKVKSKIKEFQKPDLYVLAIGLDEYKNQAYNLNYCVKDMQSFKDSLQTVSRNLFDSIYVKTLVNSNASNNKIVFELKEISKYAKPEDVFILYYAGHGYAPSTEKASSVFYFITHGVTQMTDANNRTQFGVSGEEVKELLKDIKATKQMAIIDACNSGTLTEQFVLRGPRMENSLAKLSRATGTVIFASTNTTQNASEISEIGHGVFTYALLNAFNGSASLKNCEITVAALKSYLDEEVPRLTKKFKASEQYPTTYMSGQDYPIGIRCPK